MKQLIFYLLFAQTPCSPWVPTIETKNNSSVAFRNAVYTLERVVRNNPHFNSITPARFRTSITFTDALAQINVKAYSKDGWDNKCGIIPQADRIAADHACISINVNKTGPHYTSLENSAIKDEKLDAFKEPVIEKMVGGQPMYYESLGNHFVMLTYNGEVPWEPVSTAEYLDFIERKLQKAIQDHKDQNRTTGLKKTKPKEAKEHAIYSKKADEMIEKAGLDLQKDLEDFRAFRNTFSPEELKKQATRGHSKYGLYTGEYPNSKALLVKIKKEFAHPGPGRIKLITIWAAGTILDWGERIEQAMETLDYKAMKQVMQ